MSSSVHVSWDPPRPGWTCGECGFAYDGCDPATTPDQLRRFGSRYAVPLSRGLRDEDLDAVLRVRPAEGVWSALEYACHVRDALQVYDHRIEKVLTEHRPSFRQMGRDSLAGELRYNEQDPAAVADELTAASTAIADRVAAVPEDGWERVGVREGEELSVAWMARNAVHEGEHHLLDIGRGLRQVRGR